MDTTPPALVSISFSAPEVTVSGLGLAPVTVHVRLTDETGVAGTPGVSLLSPRESIPWVDPGLGLTLTSGTAQDGVWSGTFPVASTCDGVWHVNRVGAADEAGNMLSADPTTKGMDPGLTVAGRHQPRVTMGFSMSVVGRGRQRVTVHGRAYDAEMGHPLPSLPLMVNDGDGCYVGDGVQVVTDHAGRYARTLGYLRYVSYPLALKIHGTVVVCLERVPDVAFAVSARIAPHTSCVDRPVPVTGNVLPDTAGSIAFHHDPRVFLQSLAAGRWRTVDTGRMRTSGRYDLTARPAMAGLYTYRVYKIGYPAIGYRFIGAVSRTIRLRAVQCQAVMGRAV